MKRLRGFRNVKRRGEWVELKFMAEAVSRGFSVSRPWGDSDAYDVGIGLGPIFLRVQVKSTTSRRCSGYICQFRHAGRKCGYRLEEVDLFAAYVIPENVWYLIPAAVVLRPTHKTGVILCPLKQAKWYRYRYERYREAWGLLAKNKEELAADRRTQANWGGHDF
jgi:hypothetical protein